MRYWWVNQNQTYKHEVAGGYLWSPKTKKNGARNPFYETMREVAPGDIVFSFKDTRIQAIGIAGSYCWESPKPVEFGAAGANWENVGWKIQVSFTPLRHKIRPKDQIDILRPLLPVKYSPLRHTTGDGNEAVYLTGVNDDLAAMLVYLVGSEATALVQHAQLAAPVVVDDIEDWERRIEQTVRLDTTLAETERLAIVRARIGQGLFKDRVRQIETRCRITGVENQTHLVASHCKPWRDATNEQRINGENGLLLTPSIDHLFDRGFIGFENNGELIVSPVAHRPSLQQMGIETERVVNVGGFTEGQKEFLGFHRESILLKARVG